MKWLFLNNFPIIRQLDTRDCGPVCLQMIFKYYGKNVDIVKLRALCYTSKEGTRLNNLAHCAESVGMRSLGLNMTYASLQEVNLPCIAHWNRDHYVVVYKIRGDVVYLADPGSGDIKISKNKFIEGWKFDVTPSGVPVGVVLTLTPTPDFYNLDNTYIDKSKFSFLFKYIKPYKGFMVQLALGLLLMSLLQMIMPFLTQSMVDVGINSHDIGFVYLMLIAQLILSISKMFVNFIRNWILLHMGARINISLISDFLIKLMKLPIGFFDSKRTGDIMMRIGDHTKLESFFTNSALGVIFALFNLVVFSFVLAYYSLKILGLFFIGNAIYVFWILFFLKRRRELNFKTFDASAKNQSTIIQLVQGMQEIKLNNCERQKRWDWERVQARLFHIRTKVLALGQLQTGGTTIIKQFTDILISSTSAILVIEGDMTFGMMMAIQSIVGSISAPIDQLMGFVHTIQDAKISLERTAEIHQKEDEEIDGEHRLQVLPNNRDISIENLSFSYGNELDGEVLKNINLNIPANKTTAIVGTSGSGKTTILKLLLGYYQINKGIIKVGGIPLAKISNKLWRSVTGAVMQDGYIFTDSIANNIGLSDEIVDKKRLENAAKMANIEEYIQSIPLKYETEIGSQGRGLSQGQKQRMLIARVVYKNPEFIFFDEATNSLDANNERLIMENLDHIFLGRTVVVVAHRLSTVKKADQIVVLEKGEIVEKGTHQELIKLEGSYYNLVKNQLELGN